MALKTELGVGLVSNPTLERQFDQIKKMTRSDFVFLRCPSGDGGLELLTFFPECNSQGFTKESFPLFKASDCFPFAAGKSVGKLTPDEKNAFDPKCFAFLDWIQAKAWFPLFADGKYLIILVAGKDSKETLDIGRVLFSWLTTQSEFSEGRSSRMHQYFIEEYHNLDALRACSTANDFATSLACMLVKVSTLVVRNSAVFEWANNRLELLAAFGSSPNSPASPKSKSRNFREMISEGSPQNEFFGERSFQATIPWPSLQCLDSALGCMACETIDKSVLRNIFQVLTPSKKSLAIDQDYNTMQVAFELDGRRFLLAVDLEVDLEPQESDFAKSAIQALAAQTRIIRRDRSIRQMAMAISS